MPTILAKRLCYLTIFLLPVYLWRFPFFGLPTNALEILMAATIVAWMSQASGRALRAAFQLRPLVWMGASLLLAGIIAGAIYTGHIREGLGIMKAWIILPFLFALASGSLLANSKEQKRAMSLLFFSGVAVGLLSLVSWIAGYTTPDGRVALAYESPNMLAMYLGITFLAGFWQTKKTPLVWTGLLCIMAGLALTQSAGAAIGLVGALVSGWVYVHRDMGRKLWITWVICAVLISFFAPLASFLSDPWEMGRTSLASRMMIWQVSLKTLAAHWFLGIGPGAFQEVYVASQAQFPPFLEWAVPHPHNIFLMTWLYGGILGVFGFGLILYSFFAQANKKTMTIPLMIIVYLLLHGAIDNTLWRNEMIVVFFFMLIQGETSRPPGSPRILTE